MFISIIIFGYNRKQFIKEAFNSAVNQSADYKNYEVVLITNFDLSFLPIRHYLDKGLKIKTRYLDGPIGLFIREALEISSGEVMCFLDDDDVFSPEKVISVLKKFTENPDLVYYSNDFEYIAIEGKPVRVRDIGQLFRGRKSELRISDMSTWKDVVRFVSYRGNAFNSNISIKKEIIKKHEHLLKYVLRIEDEIIFSLALDSGGVLMLDCDKLTYYRIHGENASRILVDNPASVSNRCEVFKREMDTFSTFLKSGTTIKTHVTIRYLSMSQSFTAVMYSSFCESTYHLNGSLPIISFVKYFGISMRSVHFLLLILYTLSKASPKLPLKLYAIFGGVKY